MCFSGATVIATVILYGTVHFVTACGVDYRLTAASNDEEITEQKTPAAPPMLIPAMISGIPNRPTMVAAPDA